MLHRHLPPVLALLVAAPATQELSGFYTIFHAGQDLDSVADGDLYSGHAAEAAFHLPPGATFDPRLVDGDCSIEYSTTLEIDEPAEYRLRVRATGGRALLFLGDVTVEHWMPDQGAASQDHLTDWLELPAAALELTILYTGEGEGVERSLFTSWERRGTGERDFQEEPLSSRWTNLDAFWSSRVSQDRRRTQGRAELVRKGCTSCHDAGDAATRREAPRLEGAGSRLGEEWMQRWIANPRALRAGADMPDLFGEEQSELEDARAIAHFLSRSSTGDATRALEADSDALASGRRLFHTLGCIACHGALASPREVLGGDFLPEELPDVEAARPFGELAGKWEPGALREFLRRPRATHPDGLMPDFDLSLREARDVAAYLVDAFGGARGEAASVDAELAARGREQYAARGCAQCHGAVDGSGTSVPSAKPLAELEHREGCLTFRPKGVPDYGFDNAMRSALRRALRLGAESAQLRSSSAHPLDHARAQIDYLGCARCHERNGAGGLAPELALYLVTEGEEVELGDEGRLPPDLTGVGHKLATSWIDEVLREGAKARPYMAARMPRFGDHNVDGLAAGLAQLSGVEPYHDSDPPPVTGTLISAGRQLAGLRGLSCISCHTYGSDAHAGTPGIELTAMAGRLRYEWFRSYMHQPARYKPGTRMPAFGSGLRRMFEGDAARQVDALWAWMNLGEDAPVPDGIASENELVLTVGERPRVMRTFLSDAGSRAIAVGFPEGVNFAFDAEEVRLVSAWRGDFLNAGGAWNGRGGNVTGGRGGILWEALDGPNLAIGSAHPDDSADEPLPLARFRGYRLDEAGVPTMQYELDDAHVEERWEPYPREGMLFRRTLAISGLDGRDVWLRERRERVWVHDESDQQQPGAGSDSWQRIECTNDEAIIRIDYEVKP